MEQGILKKGNMLTALGVILYCSRKGQKNLKVENKSFMLANAGLAKESKNALVCLSATKHEKYSSYVSQNLLSLAIDVKRKFCLVWKRRSESWNISALKISDY